MDKELKGLMDKLRSVSAIDTTRRLNERNVIDVLQQLLKRNLIQGVYSADGKEFVTKDELLRCIQEELEVHGGRLNIVDLPQLIGVDMRHIEAVLPQFLAEAKQRQDPVTTMNGELFTEPYFQSVIEEVIQRLGTEPRIALADTARKFQLPTQFVTQLLQKAIPSDTAVIEENVLCATTYIVTQTAIVRGAVRGALLPMPLQQLSDRLGVGTTLLHRILERLIGEGDVEGDIVGGVRGSFVAASYVRSRDALVHEFYSRNGFVEYTYLRSAGISESAPYMTSRYGLSMASLGGDKAAASTKSTSGKRAPKTAVAAASSAVVAKTPLSGLALSSCFLSDRLLLETCLSPLEEMTAESQPVVLLSQSLPPCVDTVRDDEAIHCRLLAEAPALLSQCEVFPGLRYVHKVALEKVTAHVKGLAHAEDVRGTRRLVLMCGKILHVAVEGAESEALVTDILAKLTPAFDTIYEEARHATAINETQKVKQLQVELDKRVRGLWNEVHILAKGIAFVAATAELSSNAAALQKMALAGPVTKVVKLLLLDTLWATSAGHVNTFRMPVTEEDFTAMNPKKLRDALPKSGTSADTILAALKCPTVADAITYMEKMSNNAEIGIVLRPLGRKEDKECLAGLGATLKAGVTACAAPTTVEELASALTRLVSWRFFQQHNIVLPPLPGKVIAPFAAFLRDPAVSRLQGSVTTCLIGTANPEDVKAAQELYAQARALALSDQEAVKE